MSRDAERYDDVFIDLVKALFGTGMNTLEIGIYLKVPEATVYNAKGSGYIIGSNVIALREI